MIIFKYKCVNPKCHKSFDAVEWDIATRTLLLNRRARRAYIPIKKSYQAAYRLVYKCPGCGLKVYADRVKVEVPDEQPEA